MRYGVEQQREGFFILFCSNFLAANLFTAKTHEVGGVFFFFVSLRVL